MSSISPLVVLLKDFISSTEPLRQNQSPESLALLIDRSKTTKRLNQIHAYVIRHGLETNQVLNFKLQRRYSSIGCVNYSLKLFNRTHIPNVFFYTSMIHGHIINGLHVQALLLFIQMLTENVEPNAFTLSTVLKACGLETGKAIHSCAHKLGLQHNGYVSTALLDVYARCGDIVLAQRIFEAMNGFNLVSWTAMIKGYANNGHVHEARRIFDKMEQRDVISWNVMIDAYAQHGMPNEALTLFRQMLKQKLKPDEATMLAVLSACSQVGAIESGQWVHSYLKSSTNYINTRVGTALIDMYSKCGSVEDARMVFDGIKDKDSVLYNAMIGGYAIHGFSQHALKLFREMFDVGLQYTSVTFISVLSACANAGLVSEGQAIFSSMKDQYGIQPKVEHYGCLVNLLGRAGQLEEAYRLVRNTTIATDSVLWGTLLNACRLHRNISLAEKIVELISERGFANSGTYVLLSHIYAETRNWDGVARVRLMIKQSGMMKEPGCSSVEVNNKVHEFVAGDVKHERSGEIYKMLEQINEWLMTYGYESQTKVVLHDLGEAEKERSLEVHSEKLALAFGLVSTKAGSTIKIFKNLRVCADCHEVMKMMSKITERKIVMRDRSRFHHCVDGLCSCGDYW